MSESRQDGTPPEPPEDGEPEVAEDSAGAALVDDPVATLEARVAELESRLRTVSAAYQQKQEEIQSVKDRLARQAAVQEEIRRGEVVLALFEPVENLHRSIEALSQAPETQAGLRMVHQAFLVALRGLGLEEVPGVGAPFDPSVHEAIATAPVPDPAQENRVVAVFSAGYRIGSRLVRPARVVIGSYTEPLGEA